MNPVDDTDDPTDDPGALSSVPRTDSAPRWPSPLVVDLDGTLLLCDTLYETFTAALLRNPIGTLQIVLRTVFTDIPALKRGLADIAPLEVERLPIRLELLAYLRSQRDFGRPLHLATGADRRIATRVAAFLGLFDQVHATDRGVNLKGKVKADALVAAFPGGFSYAGDSPADLAVWRRAASAVVVSSNGLAGRARSVTEIEFEIEKGAADLRPWLRAMRPHQWAKNLLVLAPVALGWPQVSPADALAAGAALALMCALTSLTYILNDIADVAADRRHPSKHRRPFAAGTLPLRDGLVVAGLGIPLVLALAYAVSPATAAALLAYCVITLSYSLGLKRVPLADAFVIGCLFTMRLVVGVVAAGLGWSAWLLTFSLFFFFSLAMAKRHTELVGAGARASGAVPGRGYRFEDEPLTLVFGVSASTASIIIVVLYLVEEVFPRGAYQHPLWLWAAPALMFLWVSRIWLLANRGQMHDDPVLFALRDRVSLGLGACLGCAFLLALF